MRKNIGLCHGFHAILIPIQMIVLLLFGASYVAGMKAVFVGSKNFQHVSLVRSVNQRKSNIIDYAMSQQHSIAVNKWHTDNARASQESISAYAPVAKSLPHIKKSDNTRLLKKFNLCYILAKENDGI